jgi:ATP-dependent Clp protease adaptor protein ClpS
VTGQVAAVQPPQVERESAPEQQTRQRTKPKRQPPYVVIVHNDDFHTFDYVIEVLRKVCGLDAQHALLLTTRIHFEGRAAVWTGPLEVAELKRDQIRNFGPDFYARRPVRFPLGVTIEPLPSGD